MHVRICHLFRHLALFALHLGPRSYFLNFEYYARTLAPLVATPHFKMNPSMIINRPLYQITSTYIASVIQIHKHNLPSSVC